MRSSSGGAWRLGVAIPFSDGIAALATVPLIKNR
jgi:hypothetical protein